MGAQEINWTILCILCGLIFTPNASCQGHPWEKKPIIDTYVDCKWPTEMQVLADSQANGTCHLVSSPAPYTLADLIFDFPSNITTKVLSDDKTTLTLTFSFQHIPKHDFQLLTYKWPDITYGLITASFHVLARPLMLDNISCEIQNWEKMVCRWTPTLKEQQEWVHNTKVSHTLEWRKGEEPFKPCPNAKENECQWKVNESPEDLTSVAVGDFVEVRVNVIYTNNSYVFPSEPEVVNTTDIVRVKPIVNMEATQHDRDILVSWSHPAPGHCIKCKLQAMSQHETKHVETESKDDKMEVQFKSLIPNTNYTISASCRACFSTLWSNVEKTYRTRPQVPEHHPSTRADAYEETDCSESHCTITFYWKPLLPYEKNGNDFFYEVRPSQSSHFNTTRFSTKIGVDPSKALDVQVLAVNSLGKAPGQPNVVRLFPREPGMVEFSVEAVNNSIVNVAVEDDVQNFTVFWCPKSTESGSSGRCNDYIQWRSSEGHSNNLTLTLPTDQDYSVKNFLFAVTTESSKSISWRSCLYDLKEAPSPPVVDLGPVQETESLNLVWKPTPCDVRSAAFADHYIVSYCPVGSCPDTEAVMTNFSCSELPKSIVVPRQEKNYDIKNLQVGTSYVAWMSSMARDGKQSAASIPVCHVILAHWLTGRVVAGIVIGCVLLAFFLITGAYFMAIRCRKAREWIKGHGMEINVPEKEKFSSQKTLTSDHLYPSTGSRGITNSLTSFDSGVGTISQSDYHHVFSMPMIRGLSSESDVDDVFEENAGEHFAGLGGKHYAHSFNTLPTLCEGRLLKEMGKSGQTGVYKGSGCNTSLGSYVLQPGIPDSVKSSPSRNSDYSFPDDVNNSNVPINTSNSNNNDDCGSLEDVRCNISCKSFPLDDLHYISTEDLQDVNVISKEMLCAQEHGYVVNNVPSANHAPQLNARSNLNRSDSPENISVPSVTLQAQQNCAHYMAHPQSYSHSPNAVNMRKTDNDTNYVPRGQRFNNRLGDTYMPGVSLSLAQTDANGYVMSDVKNSPVLNGLNTQHSVSEKNSPVSVPKSVTAKDVHKADNDYLCNQNGGYVELPAQGGLVNQPSEGAMMPSQTGLSSSLFSSSSNTQGYVALPSTNTSYVTAPQQSISSPSLSNSTSHSPTPDSLVSPTFTPVNSFAPNLLPGYIPIPAASGTFSVNTQEISSNACLAAPICFSNTVVPETSSAGQVPVPNSNGYVDVKPNASATTTSQLIPEGQSASPGASECADVLSSSTASGGYMTAPQPSTAVTPATSNCGYVVSPLTSYNSDIPRPTPSITNTDASLSSSYAAAPPTSPSGYAAAPLNSSSDYATSPVSSSGGYVAVPLNSSNDYDAAPLPSCSYATVPSLSSSGYTAAPATPSRGYATAPLNVSSGYAAVPSTPSSTYVATSPTTSSGYMTAPPISSSGYAAAPPNSSSDYAAVSLTSSSGYSAAPPTSSGYATVPQISSSDYAAAPLPSSSCPTVPPTSSSNYVATPMNGYTAAPLTSLADHTIEPVTSSIGYVATSPTTSSSGYATVAPICSSGYVAAPPTSSSGYVTAPRISSSSYAAVSPTSSSSNIAAPPTSTSDYSIAPLTVGSYVATPSSGNFMSQASPNGNMATPQTSSDGYVAMPPVSLNATTAPCANGDEGKKAASSSLVTTSCLTPSTSTSCGTTTAVSMNGYVTLPQTSSTENSYAAVPSRLTSLPSPTSGYVTAPPGEGAVAQSSGTEYMASPTTSSNSYMLMPSAPTTTETGSVTAPVIGSNGFVHGLSSSSGGYIMPPTTSSSSYVAAPAIPHGYVASLPNAMSNHTAVPDTLSTVCLLSPPTTMNGYVAIPPTSSAANTSLDDYAPAPSIPNGYVANLPSAMSRHDALPDILSTVCSPSPPTTMNGYVAVPPTSSAPITSPDDYAPAPLTSMRGSSGPPSTSSIDKVVSSPPSMNGYVTAPSSSLPTTSPTVDFGTSTSMSGYVAALSSSNYIVGSPSPNGLNGNVTAPQTSSSYVGAPLTSSSSSQADTCISPSGYAVLSPLPHVDHAPDEYTTLPGKYNTMKPVNGYVSTPSPPANSESPTKLCNDDMFADYVTNPSSIVKPSFMLAV